MSSLAHCFAYVQGTLFPRLTATLETPLTAQHQELIWVLTALRVEDVVDGPYRWHRVGVVPHDRRTPGCSTGCIPCACRSIWPTA